MSGILSANPACNPICRACHYKNLDYPAQLGRKTEWAEKQLGRWPKALRAIEAAPPSERLAYRSKTWLRSHYDESQVSFGQVSFGMIRSRFAQDAGRWEDEFVSWDTCPLHIEPIQLMIERIKPPLSQTPAMREFVKSSLVGLWMGSPHLVMISRASLPLEILKSIPWDQVLVPPFEHAWFHVNSQVGKKIFGHREIEKIAGPSTDSSHPIRAFRQVAQRLLTEARARAVRALLEYRPDFVLDLYCGTGDLSLLLPAETGWLGIELSSEAVKYANGLRSAPLPTTPPNPLHEAFVGTVEHRLGDPRVRQKILGGGRCALYLNPPRSGLSESARRRILEILCEAAPTRVVYLSCSASSLARDLTAFEQAGYEVELLQPYDFFPQTEHFETLAVLKRTGF